MAEVLEYGKRKREPKFEFKQNRKYLQLTKRSKHWHHLEETPHSELIPERPKVQPKEQLIPLETRKIPLPPFSWVDTKKLALLMCYREDVAANTRDPNLFVRLENIEPKMRSILLDWMLEVCEVYKLRRSTYYLAVDLLDRYLTRLESINRRDLQPLGITAVFIAAKVEEVYPPRLEELAYVTDGACSCFEIMEQEKNILFELDFDVTTQTVSGWLYLYLQLASCEKPGPEINDEFIIPQMSTYAFLRASQLLDLCSLDAGMLKWQYSVIAASSIYYITNLKTALYVSGYTKDKIKECVRWMAPFAEVIRRAVLTTPLPIKYEPKSSCKLCFKNQIITMNESYTVQTHAVSLEMLDEVYQIRDTVPNVMKMCRPGIDSVICISTPICEEPKPSTSGVVFKSTRGKETVKLTQELPKSESNDSSSD